MKRLWHKVRGQLGSAGIATVFILAVLAVLAVSTIQASWSIVNSSGGTVMTIGSANTFLNGLGYAVAAPGEFAAIQAETDQIGTVVNTGGLATIGGVFGDAANDSLVDRLGAIKSDTNALLSASSDNLTVLLDGVYVDSVTGVVGTAWPLGTPTYPVSNLTDAIDIATARNLAKIYIRPSLDTLDIPADATQFIEFIGSESVYGDLGRINLNGQRIGAYYTFRNISIYGNGTATSEIHAEDSSLDGGTYDLMMADNSYFTGNNDIILRQGGLIENSIFNAAYLDMTSNVGSVKLLNVHGNLAITNLVGGSFIEIAGSALKLYILNSCNSGTITVFGDVKIINTSSGTVVNDYTNKPRAETPVNITADNTTETNFLNLATAETHYTIDDLVLKAANPGANTINVRLYKLVNGGSVNTQTFAITTVNYGTYFDINTMFGLKSLAGDDIKITVETTAGGPYAVTGSYTYRSN